MFSLVSRYFALLLSEVLQKFPGVPDRDVPGISHYRNC